MSMFGERLKSLLDENMDVTISQLSAQLGFKDNSNIYQWLRGANEPKLNKAIIVANVFDCSLDYLVGRVDVNNADKFKTPPPFHIQLKSILFDLHISQYKLIKDNVISRGNLNNWLNLQCEPTLFSLINLADYLKISLDQLVGRV